MLSYGGLIFLGADYNVVMTHFNFSDWPKRVT